MPPPAGFLAHPDARSERLSTGAERSGPQLPAGCNFPGQCSRNLLLEPVLGPMRLRVGTFLPFTLAVFLNGHAFLAQDLTRLGVGFRKDDNAFLAVDDLAALEAAAERLTPHLIEQRVTHWVRQLAPRFTADERAAVDLHDRSSVAQIELATDVLFRRAAPLKALFQRATELGILLGGADRTTHLFGRRITARYGGKLQTVLDRRNAGQPILRSYDGSSFVKQDEKGDRLLRTETCLNNTYDVGVGRHLDHLPASSRRCARPIPAPWKHKPNCWPARWMTEHSRAWRARSSWATAACQG